jgi:hypothetical protein
VAKCRTTQHGTPLKFTDIERSLKEEALRKSDADCLQRVILTDLFDAFRDDRCAELVREKTNASIS